MTILNDARLDSASINENGVSATYSGEICKIIVSEFVKLFKDYEACNYLEIIFTDKIDDEEYSVTIQRKDKPTAHELRRKAEAHLVEAMKLLMRAKVELQGSCMSKAAAEIDQDIRAYLTEMTNEQF